MRNLFVRMLSIFLLNKWRKKSNLFRVTKSVAILRSQDSFCLKTGYCISATSSTEYLMDIGYLIFCYKYIMNISLKYSGTHDCFLSAAKI